MIAAACTPVAVRNASLPASGYWGWIATWVAREAVWVHSSSLVRSRSSSPSSLRLSRIWSSAALPTRSPVPRALADAERGTVDAVGAVLDREDRVDHAQAAVVVAVPVDPDIGAARAVEHVAGELEQVADAVGRGVTDGVAHHQALRAVVDRVGEQLGQHLGARPRGVLGDVRHRQVVAAAEVDRVGAELEQPREVPVLGVLPDRRAADEAEHLELDADLLRDVDEGVDVVLGGARRAAGLEREPVLLDVRGDRGDVVDRALAGTGQADVDMIDAELAGELDQPDLVLDRRIDHRGRLDAVAQGLVEELHAAPRRQRGDLLDRVPVVDQLMVCHRVLAARSRQL